MAVLASVGSLVEFKLRGFFDGSQELNNIFHYRVNEISAVDLQQAAAGLWHTLTLHLLASLSTVVEFTEIQASILDTHGAIVNGETYVIKDGTGAGTDATDSLPPFVCFTFRYQRPSSAFRHGYKRFAGVPEDAQVKGLVASGSVTGLNDVANDLRLPITAYTIDTDGSPLAPVTGDTLEPVLVQRFKNGDAVDPVVVYAPSTVIFSKIGSQNSRKYGRGS